MADLSGTTIGQLQILERLGRGGMADVYKAFHPGLALYRAVKVIRPEFVTETDFRARFQREAQAVAALRHPNIVQVHDFGVQDELYYMIMEFVEGQDLKSVLLERGPIRPFSEVVDIVEQVAGALHYAHQQGLVHRDIKPANIMLTATGQAILMDFGIAKMLSLEEQMTQPGIGIGTPAYMAPEQVKGMADLGPPADIYSLGVVLYEMLTSKLPYSADTPMAVMLQVVNDPMPPPRSFSPDIPDVLQGVILKATAKEPAQRYPTALALVEGLKQSLGRDPGSAATIASPLPAAKAPSGRRRAPWLIAGGIGLGLLCLLAVVIGLFGYNWFRPQPALASWQFVIDASANMAEEVDGQTKMEIARAALAEELDILPANVEAGLRVFGGGVSGQTDCDDTRLLVDPATGRHQALAGEFAGLSPAGEAPLTRAIVEAIGDFEPNPARRQTLIIITAGLDSCAADAISQLERLNQRLDLEVELHLIGLGVAAEADREQLRQLAAAAGGAYHDAQNQTQIGNIIAPVVAQLATPGRGQSTAAATATVSDVAEAASPTPAEEPTPEIETVSSTGGELQISQIVAGAITAGERVTYTFTAEAGDVARLRAVEPANGNFNPLLELFDAQGQLIGDTWDYDDVILDVPLDSGGSYSLLLSDQAGNYGGDYSLSLQRLNGPEGVEEIAFGQTLAGAIDSLVQMAPYRFTAEAGDVVRLRAVAPDGNSFDPLLELFDAEGQPIDATWDYDDVVLDVGLDSGGEYFVLLSDENGMDLGDYTLTLRRLSNPIDVADIGFDQTLTGAVEASGEMPAYSFVAEAGDMVRLRMAEPAGGSFDPQIELFDAQGQQLDAAWNYDAVVMDILLEEGGTYYVLAGDYDGKDVGDYSLYLRRLNHVDGTEGIAFGQTATGAIDEAGQMLAYSFSADEADMVRLRLANPDGGSFDPQLELFDGQGQELDSTWDYDAVVMEIELEEGGTFLVLLSDYDGRDSGDYGLYLQRLNEPAGADEIEFGQMASGTIDEAGQMLAYNFTADEGDVIRLRLANPDGGSFDPQIELFDGQGQQLDGVWDYDAVVLDVEVEEGGTFAALLSDYDGIDSGDIYLYPQRLNDPAGVDEIEFGQTITASLDEPGQMAAYVFSAEAGDTIQLEMAGLDGGSFDPQLELFDSQGQQLDAVWDYDDAILDITLEEDGPYTVLLSDYDGKDSGEYQLNLR